jgi:hypothetical protein
MIRFACPLCNASMKADEQYAGKLIACKQCGEQITIPLSLPPPRLNVPALEPAAEEAPQEDFAAPPPVRRPVGAEAVLTTNGDHPPQPLPIETAEEYEPSLETSTTSYEQPTGRQFGVLSTMLGLPGAVLFAAGVFFPLFFVSGRAVEFVGWPLWLVQSGGIMLCIVALFVVVTKRYGGLWVLGPGTLLAFLAVFGVFFARIQEERGFEVAKSLRPGMGLLLLLGGAALLTLAALCGPRRKRYEYHG